MSEWRKWVSRVVTHGLEIIGLYYGSYEGEVFSNSDPLKRGRIRAKCNALWPDDVDPPNIWAWPKYGQAHAEKAGWWWPLKPGDPVRIECRYGNPGYPIYTSGWWGDDDIPDEAEETDGNDIRFFRTPEGFEWKISDATGEMWLSMPDRKAYLHMKGDGWIDLWSGTDKGWFTLLPNGSLQHVTYGTVNNRLRINADGTIFIGPEDETRELIRLLNELLDALVAMTIPTAAGAQPPVNLATFIDIKTRIATLVAPMP
jgi:hypothetical protein